MSANEAAPPSELLTRLDAHQSELRTLTEELVGHDTQNPPGETVTAVEWVESVCADAGLETERVAVDPQKPNLVVPIPGASERTLCLNGHLDTVPFEASDWTYDPLGEWCDDRLYGRGGTDVKGAVAAMLYVAREYARTKVVPPVTLQLALVSDEETGGDAGLDALLDREWFAPTPASSAIFCSTER